MRLIKSSIEVIQQGSGLDGIYKQIELVGRTCYKSEDRISKDSAKTFVDMLEASGHGAMLEHGTIYLDIPIKGDFTSVGEFVCHDLKYLKYLKNSYSRVELTDNPTYRDSGWNAYKIAHVTTNYRVLVENEWLYDLAYLCEPTPHHRARITIKFICDRGVSHEFVRHRTMSFAQESTRYCNYSKDKFGKELTFIIPSWCTNMVEKDLIKWKNWSKLTEEEKMLYHMLDINEENYFLLLEHKWKPQQARAVLPNALKTELVVTGFMDDWVHFMELRSPKYGAKGVHPDAARLGDMVFDELVASIEL